MRIKRVESQYGRDFTATYECEHCGHSYYGSGYDDRNFHENVIPEWKCPKCGRKSPDTYRPRAPWYPEGTVV